METEKKRNNVFSVLLGYLFIFGITGGLIYGGIAAKAAGWDGTIVFFIVGGAFFLLGIAVIIMQIRNNWYVKYGTKIEAKVIDVVKNVRESTWRNSSTGRNETRTSVSWELLCEYQDPLTKETYTFKNSSSFEYKKEKVISKTVTVYIKGDDYLKYHVDDTNLWDDPNHTEERKTAWGTIWAFLCFAGAFVTALVGVSFIVSDDLRVIDIFGYSINLGWFLIGVSIVLISLPLYQTLKYLLQKPKDMPASVRTFILIVLMIGVILYIFFGLSLGLMGVGFTIGGIFRIIKNPMDFWMLIGGIACFFGMRFLYKLGKKILKKHGKIGLKKRWKT